MSAKLQPRFIPKHFEHQIYEQMVPHASHPVHLEFTQDETDSWISVVCRKCDAVIAHFDCIKEFNSNEIEK
jgi:hypothetical protein